MKESRSAVAAIKKAVNKDKEKEKKKEEGKGYGSEAAIQKL
jgi:hypothetical protein